MFLGSNVSIIPARGALNSVPPTGQSFGWDRVNQGMVSWQTARSRSLFAQRLYALRKDLNFAVLHRQWWCPYIEWNILERNTITCNIQSINPPLEETDSNMVLAKMAFGRQLTQVRSCKRRGLMAQTFLCCLPGSSREQANLKKYEPSFIQYM